MTWDDERRLEGQIAFLKSKGVYVEPLTCRDVTPNRTEDPVSGDRGGPYQLIIDQND